MRRPPRSALIAILVSTLLLPACGDGGEPSTPNAASTWQWQLQGDIDTSHDVDRFAPDDLGTTLDGWDDERWLDTRWATVRTVMESGLDLAVERGCDGVEPDNVDDFDFAVNEQCADDTSALCARSWELGLRTLVLPLDLDGSFRISCDD